MTYTEVTEIGPGCLVEATGNPLTIKVGKNLIGNVVDALGQRLDQKPLNDVQLTNVLTEQQPPNPLSRPPISEPIQVGIKADRKSTRLNSSHVAISYAVFCLKKKKIKSHVSVSSIACT